MIQAIQQVSTATPIAPPALIGRRFCELLLYRKPNIPHALSVVVAIIFVTVYSSTNRCEAQEWDQQTVRFVGDVAVGTEYSRTDQVVKKWVEPAKLSLFNATEGQSQVVSQAVEQVNNVLASTDMSIKTLEPGDEDATLKVIFAPYNKFETVAEEHEFKVVPGNYGGFYIWWNERYEIERAVVLLSSDRLRNRQLLHFALEEISQSLGFPGDSSRFRKSVFYANPAEREHGDAIRFSDLDRKLMRFIYQHVEPGTPPVELGIIMSQHWAETE